MIEVLVIVDVQKEFSSFIQHDLVDELHNYAENFTEVYQVWDTHKTNVAPTYKFPNQVDSYKKLFGVKHFSDKVKEFTDKMEDDSYEGRTFKLAGNEGYVVRVDNNHDWFYVNPEIVELISKLKDKKVILVGGADNECLEDVYQAFLAFGLDVEFNKKYVYSAKTDNDDSIGDKQVNESIIKYPYESIVVTFDNIDEVKEYAKMYEHNYLKVSEQLIRNTIIEFARYDSIYFKYRIDENELIFDSWCHVKYLLDNEPDDYEKLFKLSDVKNNLFDQILTKGYYTTKPSYEPKKIVRTLESVKKYPYDEIVVVFNNIGDIREFAKMYSNTHLEISRSLAERAKEYFEKDDSVYYRYKVHGDRIAYEGWGNLGWLIEQNDNTYEKLFYLDDLKKNLFNQIINNGQYIDIPSYKPKRIERTLESIEDNTIYINEITGQPTKYKYRFKTEDEFRDEFNSAYNGWYTDRYMWVQGMSYLYGKDLEVLKTSFTTDKNDDIRNYNRTHHPSGNGWIVTGYMVKENKIYRPSYKPKRIERTLEDKVLKLDEYLLESNHDYETKKNAILERIKEHRYFMVYADDKQNMLRIKNLLELSGIKHKKDEDDYDDNKKDIDTHFKELSTTKRLSFTIYVDYNSMFYKFETYSIETLLRYKNLFIKIPNELKLLNDIGIIKIVSNMYKPKRIVRTLESNNEIYVYVAISNKKDSYDFEKLLNDNNYIYFDEEETEDMINIYNTAYDIEDDENKYFLFFIDLDKKDYVLRVRHKESKNEMFYPKQKGEIMRELNIIPIYKPKKINRSI